MFRRAATVTATAVVFLAVSAQGAAPPHASGRDELNQVEADRKSREQERDALRVQAADARKEIAGLQRQLVALAADQAKGERDVADKRRRLDTLNAQEAELTTRMGRNRAELARLLGALQLYRRNPPPALLVNPHDARDAVRAAILMRAVTPELERRAAAFRAEAEDIERLRREAASASEDLFTSESAVGDRRSRIEAMIAEKTTLERSLTGDAIVADQDVRALAAKAQSLRELLQSLPAQGPAGQPPPPDPDKSGLLGGPKPFVTPVQGEIARRFGAKLPQGGASEGWTYATLSNAQVVAPAQGVVDYAGPLKGMGLVLILRLGGGYHLVLAGLDTILAAPGRSVAAGEPVGRMGDGGSSAPELYIEVRKDGAPVDPARWLKASR